MALGVSGCMRTQPTQTAPTNQTSPPFVSFCELLAHPNQYDQKIVRPKATQFSGIDTAAFRSLDCDFDDAWMRANCSPDGCAKMSNAVDQLLGKPHFRQTVTYDMVGQFLAYDEDQRNHRFRVLDVTKVELANGDDFKFRKRS